MPVDLDLEHTWPVCYAEPATTDAVPVVLVLTDLPTAGDFATVDLTAMGADAAGTLGEVLTARYGVMNIGGVVTPVAHGLVASPLGAGGLTIGTAVVGSEFRLSLTGIALTPVNWTVLWRLCERVFPP